MDDKNQLLSQLYTLRAGMSWIAQKKSETENLMNSIKIPNVIDVQPMINRQEQCIKELEDDLESIESDKRSALIRWWPYLGEKINSFLYLLCAIGLFAAMIGAIFFAHIAFANFHLETIFFFLFWLVITLGFLAGAGYCVYAVFYYLPYCTPILLIGAIILSISALFMPAIGNLMNWMNLGNDEFWGWVCLIAGGILLISGVAQLGKYLRYVLHERKGKAAKRALRKRGLDTKEVEIRCELIKARNELETLRKERIPAMKRKNQKDIQNAYDQLDHVRNDIVKPIIELSKGFYRALMDSFNSLVDVRDWSNIDLIIYYVETNRAATVREALQLMDRELQTDRVVKTLGIATNAICESIKSGFNDIGGAISYGFRAIENNISTIQENFNNQIGSLQNNMVVLQDSVERNTALQISQTSLTNALLAKSNESSKQLVDEIHSLNNKLI